MSRPGPPTRLLFAHWKIAYQPQACATSTLPAGLEERAELSGAGGAAKTTTVEHATTAAAATAAKTSDLTAVSLSSD
jgi:hypothetical protein